ARYLIVSTRSAPACARRCTGKASTSGQSPIPQCLVPGTACSGAASRRRALGPMANWQSRAIAAQESVVAIAEPVSELASNGRESEVSKTLPLITLIKPIHTDQQQVPNPLPRLYVSGVGLFLLPSIQKPALH